MLARIVASYEADPALQQELLQEVSVALWQALRSFRGDGSLKAYAARIAQNRCISHVAKAVRAPRQTGLDDEMLSDLEGPEEAVVRSQQRQVLLAAVRELPLPLREVTTLALEGFSHREIGEALGISENNAMVRFSRAKASLKTAMNPKR
ncbi:MAG: sigma-70 family RNA polymerase sigma factor [Alphaproteobacteria bacterium]|nr:sigma-70 family RNA polymerase sigma factor [Alphaproteobacteria bacterium]